MHTSTGVLKNPRRKLVMNVTLTCFSRNCGKPRFLEYYVCVEHFVCYAAPRYAESMVINPEPIAAEFWRIYLEESSSSEPQRMARKSSEREITKEATIG
jgi:hypothetical protein